LVEADKPAAVMSVIMLSRNSVIEVILRSSYPRLPALEEISSIASPRETCSNYGEAVQSNVFYVMPIAPPADAAISRENRVF
jgi:hypothetical protein